MPDDKKEPEQLTLDSIKEASVAVEEAPTVETSDAKTPDPSEVAAKTQGWKPKEEFTGDPALWVDAKEFLGRAPLFDKIKEQGKTIKKVEKTIDAMSRHFEKNLEHAVTAKINELKAAKKEAIEGGDVAKVEAIDKQIEDQKAAKADIPTAPQVAPEVMEWVKDNPWYTKDHELHDFALAYNDAYLKRNPGDLEGSLKATATATRKAFPDKFPEDRKPAVSAAPTVESSTAPSAAAKKYSVSKLSPEQKLVYDQIVTKHGVVKPEQFFKSLEEIGEYK